MLSSLPELDLIVTGLGPSSRLDPPAIGATALSPLFWLGDSVPLLKQTTQEKGWGQLIVTSLLEDLEEMGNVCETGK